MEINEAFTLNIRDYEGFATLEKPTFVLSILDALGKTGYVVITIVGKVTALAKVQEHYMFFDRHQNNRQTFLPVCGKHGDAIVRTGNEQKKTLLVTSEKGMQTLD